MGDLQTLRIMISTDNHLVRSFVVACSSPVIAVSCNLLCPAQQASSSPADVKCTLGTYIHLQGVWEQDDIRKNDSFQAFEEVLKKAVEMDVDMVLLGGDLFHENKPSRHTVV